MPPNNIRKVAKDIWKEWLQIWNYTETKYYGEKRDKIILLLSKALLARDKRAAEIAGVKCGHLYYNKPMGLDCVYCEIAKAILADESEAGEK